MIHRSRRPKQPALRSTNGRAAALLTGASQATAVYCRQPAARSARATRRHSPRRAVVARSGIGHTEPRRAVVTHDTHDRHSCRCASATRTLGCETSGRRVSLPARHCGTREPLDASGSSRALRDTHLHSACVPDVAGTPLRELRAAPKGIACARGRLSVDDTRLLGGVIPL